ncbi:ArsC family reductase [Alkalilimnicola ehrlichii]|uniref:ArsC family reductase n=1 Tax=Alkalilimnicola ehrlichii TaxID=351052 RepID=A0A3E0WRM3_9GAMM|nr:ArsC family reductase [Alkalilimnicola ehrlichii]RFA34843.1 ArsC family reductase [Alkalilimnicola ehrlichii]
MIVYGIKNCDTVRKARRWLDQRGVDYSFHDLRQDGLERSTVERWCQACDWECLLNRRGRTYRLLPDERKQDLNETRAIDLMISEPTVIKRPVVERDGEVVVGFDDTAYSERFAD